MKATAYPDLIRDHRPTTLEGIQLLLPKGQGTPYDQEQAACARRLHDSGMSANEIGVRFGVSASTVSRWLNPGSYEAALQAKRAAAARRAETARRDGEAKRAKDRRAPEPGVCINTHTRRPLGARPDGHRPRTLG